MDGLLCVVIAVVICEICFDAYYLFLRHEEGRQSYRQRVNEKLEEISAEIEICVPCIIEDEQSQTDLMPADCSYPPSYSQYCAIYIIPF